MMIPDSTYHSKELDKGSLNKKNRMKIGLFVHKIHQFGPDTGENMQNHCEIANPLQGSARVCL